MSRAINWWMGRPCDLKYAVAGILAPHVLMGITYWLAH